MKSLIKRLFKQKTKETDCRDVHELSSDYIEAELIPEAADKIRRHLNWCPPCSAFVATLRATVNLLRSFSSAEAPSELRQRITRRLHEDTRQ